MASAHAVDPVVESLKLSADKRSLVVSVGKITDPNTSSFLIHAYCVFTSIMDC